ncbi:AGAP007272-PA-like protein [Anopheles sinensis]|uniref:AGAP007272-PA-like protein n=1 Tax=Anopheles sinensis TaxID=74873 RepID=A0A084VQT8_ANOSI|nr:AGAP007272-PA-like protein [Anopheles sinensis]
MLVLAKPDFGINLGITGSGKVTLATNDAKDVVDAVSENTVFTADSNYPGLQDLANLLKAVADLTVKLSDEMVPLVTSLVADMSGDVAGAFGPVLAKITEMKTAIGTELPKANTAIEALVGHYIPDQFTDGFGRIDQGLTDLETILGTLKAAIDAAVLQAGGADAITPAIVKKNVKPALVYRVVFSINQLKAYIPVVKYTIDSTLENINLADDYVVLVSSAVVASAATNTQLQAQISTVTDAITRTVETELDGYVDTFGTLQTSVGDLEAVAAATEYAQLTTALEAYKTHLDSLQATKYPALDGYLEALLEVFKTALPSTGSSGGITSDLLDSLILTLIENGKYAQFCFYKYYGLVLAFLTTIADNASLCFDKEERRLTYLKDSLPLITQLLAFDFDSILDQVGICDTVTDSTTLGECITTLSGFYTTIATEFGHKMQYVFDLIKAETEASGNRFLICIELVKLNLVEISEANLEDEIRQCALGGPTADDNV